MWPGIKERILLYGTPYLPTKYEGDGVAKCGCACVVRVAPSFCAAFFAVPVCKATFMRSGRSPLKRIRFFGVIVTVSFPVDSFI